MADDHPASPSAADGTDNGTVTYDAEAIRRYLKEVTNTMNDKDNTIVRLTEEGATVRATNVMLNETIKSLRDEINHNAELHTTRLNNNAKTIASLKAEIAKLEKALRSKEDQIMKMTTLWGAMGNEME